MYEFFRENLLLNKACQFSFSFSLTFILSWENIVGRVIGYRLNNRGVGVPSPSRVKNVLFFMFSRPAVGPTQPPIQWVMGALSLRVQGQGCEADHSHPTSAEVKKMWTYTSTPHMPSWRSASLVKHRDNFTFTLTVILSLSAIAVALMLYVTVFTHNKLTGRLIRHLTTVCK
jgi:hypothetical protein